MQESEIDMDDEFLKNQEDGQGDKSNLGGTIIAGAADQTKMTMTIGMDGLADTPAKSMFKDSKNKVYPELKYPDYTKSYGMDNEDFPGLPDSGKYDSRTKFNINNPLRDSKTDLHSQESIFEKKKQSTNSEN